MLKKILLGLVVIVGLFSVFIATRPPEYRVSRELAMNAAPSVIFPHINESKKMNAWNPWTQMDKEAVIAFSGPEAGVGAKTSWDSKGQLGVGSATVIESVENQSVKTRIDYLKPMVMEQDSEMTLTPNGNQTIVRWSVVGKNKFFGRMMCFFMNMDKMVGGTFETGLNTLKGVVEGQK